MAFPIAYLLRALATRNPNSILFYYFKKSFYCYTISFYNTSNLKTLFLLKYYFLTFLYYFFPTVFQYHFPEFSNSHFYSSLSLSTSSTGSIHRATHTQRPMIHRLTYPNLSPHTQSHTHTNTNHQTINKATHTQTIKPVGANNGHHTHHPSHRSANPSHQSETHVVNLKPKPSIKKNITGANLFKKKIITGANPLKKNHHGATRANPLKKNHLRSHHRSY